jgi:hypothetical protein
MERVKLHSVKATESEIRLRQFFCPRSASFETA